MLKRSLLVILSFALAYNLPLGDAKPNDMAASFQSPKIRLPKGTTVKLRVIQPISSATARLGDRVDLEVAEDVKVDGAIIIPKNGKAEGFVAEAMSGQLWGAGSVAVYVGSLLTRTGFRLPVHGFTTASAITGAATNNASREVMIGEGTEIMASTEIDIPLEAAFYRETELAASK